MNRDKRMQCLIKQIVKKTECTEQDAQRYIRIVLDEYADKYISALLKNDYLKIYYGCLSEHYLIKGDMDRAIEYGRKAQEIKMKNKARPGKAIEETAQLMQKGEIDREKGYIDYSEFNYEVVTKLGIQRLAGAKALYNAGYGRVDDIVDEFVEGLKAKESPKLLAWEYGEGYLDCIKTAEQLADEMRKEVKNG